MLRPVAGRPYLRQDAADEIRRYVLDSKLQPGDRLPSERELCAQLGLSRTSVREALRLLEQEGLVEVRQGRPPVVRPFDLMPVIQPVVYRLASERHLLRDLLEVRAPLEVLAARAAATQRSENDLAEMREILERMRSELDQGMDPVEEDVLFHDVLYRAAQNTVLLAFSRAVKDLLRAVREAARHAPARAGTPTESQSAIERLVEQSWQQHTAIYEAVAAGDAAAAGKVMQQHMDSVRRQQRAAQRFLDRVAAGTGEERRA